MEGNVLLKSKGISSYESRSGYLLVSPGLLIYTIFVLIPIAVTLILSFTNYNLLQNPSFIGIKNYIKLFKDALFITSLENTFKYSFWVIFTSMVVGLLLAVLLNGNIKLKKIFRAVIYLPNAISMIAASMAWLYLYDLNGIFNIILSKIGLLQHNWLADVKTALGSIIIMGIWQNTGYIMIIYLSGLQSIPESLYEAAQIDRVSKIKQFFYITLPMLAPTTFFLMVMSFINSFQVFGQVYVMTNGGPVNSTTTVAHQIYRNAFEGYQMGYASAMAIFLLVVAMIVTLINFRYGNEDNDVELG